MGRRRERAGAPELDWRAELAASVRSRGRRVPRLCESVHSGGRPRRQGSAPRELLTWRGATRHGSTERPLRPAAGIDPEARARAAPDARSRPPPIGLPASSWSNFFLPALPRCNTVFPAQIEGHQGRA